MVTVTNAGVAAVARMLNNVSPPGAFVDIATGSGSTAESASDTALANENTAYGFQRAAATCTFVSPGTAKWTHAFTASGGIVTLREIGILNEAGDLFLRHVLSEDVTYDAESVIIAVTMTIGRA